MLSMVPNALSLLRGGIIVVIAVLFFVEVPYRFELIYVLFLLGAGSDWLDGYIARRYNLVSDLGALLDSLFDKAFSIALFVLIAPLGVVHGGLLIALILRELVVDGVKNYCAGRGRVLHALWLGKVKFVAVLLMLHSVLLGQVVALPYLVESAYVFGGVALVAGYVSGYRYIRLLYA